MSDDEKMQVVMDKINRIETMLDGFPTLKLQMQNMVYWWSGNGSPGAREYIQKLVTEERLDEIIKSTVQAVMEEEAQKKRGQTEHRLRVVDVVIAVGMFMLIVIQLFGVAG